MKSKDLQGIALLMFNKGYTDNDTLRYCDDLYKATEDEVEECVRYLDEIKCMGTTAFTMKYFIGCDDCE